MDERQKPLGTQGGTSERRAHRGGRGRAVVLHELLAVVLGVLEQRVGHGGAQVHLHGLLQLGHYALLHGRGSAAHKVWATKRKATGNV